MAWPEPRAGRQDGRPVRTGSIETEASNRLGRKPMLRIFTLAAAAVLGFTGTASAQYAWKPDKPITIVVPWGAGGSTDQVVRLLAKEIEAAIKQTVVIVNQPGA